MKQFIQIKLPAHPITVPTSAIVFLRPFVKSDMPMTEITPNYFRHADSWYNSERSGYTKNRETITQDEYYTARKAYEEDEQQRINEKYSQVKTAVYIRLMGNTETQKELVEDSYEEISAKLTSEN